MSVTIIEDQLTSFAQFKLESVLTRLHFQGIGDTAQADRYGCPVFVDFDSLAKYQGLPKGEFCAKIGRITKARMLKSVRALIRLNVIAKHLLCGFCITKFFNERQLYGGRKGMSAIIYLDIA